jgi:purine-binding chemotaxis protein CheW
MDNGNAWFLVCRSHGKLCALPVSRVVETMRPQPVQSLAQMPPGMLGVAVIRGQAMPVLSLAALLGGATASAPELTHLSSARFVTLTLPGGGIALAVPEVVGLQKLDTGNLHLPALMQHDDGILSALGLLDAELLLLLQDCRSVSEQAWMAMQEQPAQQVAAC